MFVIEISFPKSKSMTHELAVEIAKSSAEYEARLVGNTVVHSAKFELNDYQQTNRAVELLHYVWGLKGIVIKIGERLAPSSFGNYMWLKDILDCYLRSLYVTDQRAYCWVVENYMSGLKVGLFNPKHQTKVCVPCAHTLFRRDRINPYHPSNIEDQFKAIAVKAGVDWCPAFNPKAAIEESRRINQMTIQIDS